MQIVIPMSGFGERFRNAGYSVPKPLIEVEGKTIIQHVVEMFPGENDITFICNEDHLNESSFRMRNILNEIAPQAKIISIKSHNLGPVHAVLQAIEHLNLEEPTIVNYADFTCDWNYADFCNEVLYSNCDGAIPCYRGFHPHTLWSNYYAYVPEKEMRALDIQEKIPFTKNPREEFASSGTYYFKNAIVMQKYFERSVIDGLTVGGEFYVSMAYKPMIQDGLNIQVYELDHFMQWGTPTDLEEYIYWSKAFRLISENGRQVQPRHEGSLMLPMAGIGSRFINEGYELPKPLIKVLKKPMAVQALLDLPSSDQQNFILRSDMYGIDELTQALGNNSSNAKFFYLDYMTDGQATTCIEGAKELSIDQPITIAACDNGMVYNSESFNRLLESSNVDVVVWAARGYPGAIRNPEMYGWIDVEETGLIRSVSVKNPLSNPKNDPIVVGAFTFKKLSYFLKSTQLMKDRGAKVNNEYYIDMSINDAISMGLRCVIFEIESYICWGTPNDLKTFEYWQTCLKGWNGHPYKG